MKLSTVTSASGVGVVAIVADAGADEHAIEGFGCFRATFPATFEVVAAVRMQLLLFAAGFRSEGTFSFDEHVRFPLLTDLTSFR